ncbi:hypothetical protein [Xanthomonas fragariae]|uniref:hypothetical protein n=1 Tax=Xanthomonas fragariae TaxID=48664 RepID=UPI0003A62A3E|nr:hypothetical protein [Xanthomonas fragariae]
MMREYFIKADGPLAETIGSARPIQSDRSRQHGRSAAHRHDVCMSHDRLHRMHAIGDM